MIITKIYLNKQNKMETFQLPSSSNKIQFKYNSTKIPQRTNKPLNRLISNLHISDAHQHSIERIRMLDELIENEAVHRISETGEVFSQEAHLKEDYPAYLGFESKAQVQRSQGISKDSLPNEQSIRMLNKNSFPEVNQNGSIRRQLLYNNNSMLHLGNAEISLEDFVNSSSAVTEQTTKRNLSKALPTKTQFKTNEEWLPPRMGTEIQYLNNNSILVIRGESSEKPNGIDVEKNEQSFKGETEYERGTNAQSKATGVTAAVLAASTNLDMNGEKGLDQTFSLDDSKQFEILRTVHDISASKNSIISDTVQIQPIKIIKNPKQTIKNEELNLSDYRILGVVKARFEDVRQLSHEQRFQGLSSNKLRHNMSTRINKLKHNNLKAEMNAKLPILGSKCKLQPAGVFKTLSDRQIVRYYEQTNSSVTNLREEAHCILRKNSSLILNSLGKSSRDNLGLKLSLYNNQANQNTLGTYKPSTIQEGSNELPLGLLDYQTKTYQSIVQPNQYATQLLNKQRLKAAGYFQSKALNNRGLQNQTMDVQIIGSSEFIDRLPYSNQLMAMLPKKECQKMTVSNYVTSHQVKTSMQGLGGISMTDTRKVLKPFVNISSDKNRSSLIRESVYNRTASVHELSTLEVPDSNTFDQRPLQVRSPKGIILEKQHLRSSKELFKKKVSINESSSHQTHLQQRIYGSQPNLNLNHDQQEDPPPLNNGLSTPVHGKQKNRYKDELKEKRSSEMQIYQVELLTGKNNSLPTVDVQDTSQLKKSYDSLISDGKSRKTFMMSNHHILHPTMAPNTNQAINNKQPVTDDFNETVV